MAEESATTQRNNTLSNNGKYLDPKADEVGERHQGAPVELLDNELTSKALGIVEKSAMSDAQLYAYERFWMTVHDEQAYLEGRYIKGREQGRAEGRAEGEYNKALESARKMKAKGYPADDIAEITGLTIDEINRL